MTRLPDTLPTTLPLAQRDHLHAACRKHTLARVSTALCMGREVVAKLAAGIPVRASTVALAQQQLHGLDAALDAPSSPSAA